MAWEKFLGQERAVSILKAYIRSGRIPNAFIFSGIDGIGKFSLAKEFAKALNCKEQKDTACDKCSNCIQIDKEIHPDLFIIRPAGRANLITIDMIRELEKFLNLSPQVGIKKIFIVDQADKMNEESSNAFLKNLEEPPLDSVIIFITSNPDNLLRTIKSRCQEIKFSALKRKVLRNILQERFNLSLLEAEYLASISQGSLSVALRFKDLDKEALIREINEFFANHNFSRVPDRQLSEQRAVLKDKLQTLVLFIRDLLLTRKELSELALFESSFSSVNLKMFRGGNAEDLIAKIEKLEYLYSALDSNVNPDLVYKIAKKIYYEVNVG